MKKIIFLGNGFAYPDSYGIEIYKHLADKCTSNDIELIEGGIGGLNLALHFDCIDDIILVDHGSGYNKKLFNINEIDLTKIKEYNHDTAFLYLLKTIEKSNINIYFSNNNNWKSSDIIQDSKEILNLVGVV